MWVTHSSQVTAASPVPGNWCSSTKCDSGCSSLPWGWRENAASAEQVSTGPGLVTSCSGSWQGWQIIREKQGWKGPLEVSVPASAEGGGFACSTKTALFCLLSLRGGWLCLPCATHLCPGLWDPAGPQCCCSQKGKAATGQTNRGTEQLSPGAAGPGLQGTGTHAQRFSSLSQWCRKCSQVCGQWNTLELHRGPTSQHGRWLSPVWATSRASGMREPREYLTLSN